MADRSSEPGVEALDGVGRVDDPAQFGGELQERGELVPGLAPGSDHRGVGVLPVRSEGLEAGFGGGDGGGGVDLAHGSGDLSPVLLGRVAQAVGAMCTTQVCTVAWGQVARIDSGRPRRPSQHTINASARPRFLSSVSIVTHCLATVAAGGAQPQPQHVSVAGQIDADGNVHGPVGDLGVVDLDHDGVDQ